MTFYGKDDEELKSKHCISKAVLELNQPPQLYLGREKMVMNQRWSPQESEAQF